MDKNIKNAPKRGVFRHLWPPKIFFHKSGSVTFVPLWWTNFMQKIRKMLRVVSEISKDRRTDGLTDWQTDGERWLHRTPSDKQESKITKRPWEIIYRLSTQNGNLSFNLDKMSYTKLSGTILCELHVKSYTMNDYIFIYFMKNLQINTPECTMRIFWFSTMYLSLHNKFFRISSNPF